MIKFKEASSQKEKSRIRRRIYKKTDRYPRKIYFLTDDNLFGSCIQNHEAFLSIRKMKRFLRTLRNGNYISPQGYDVLSKRHHWLWPEGCTVFMTGKLKLRKHDIKRLYNLTTS